MRSCHTVWRAISAPKATRPDSRFTISPSARSAKSDEAHAVMDPAGAEPSLSDLETATFALQHVGRRHAHIDEIDLHVPVRCVVRD
jgi:hypothetical protein